MAQDGEKKSPSYHFVDEKTGAAVWVVCKEAEPTSVAVEVLLRVAASLVPGHLVKLEPATVSVPAPPAVPSPLVNRAAYISPALLNKPIGELKLSPGAEKFARVNLEADIIGRLVAWKEPQIVALGKREGKRKEDVARWLKEIKEKLEIRGARLGMKLKGWESPSE